MTQPDLFTDQPRRRTKAGHVRTTSRLAHQEGLARFDKREALTAGVLVAWTERNDALAMPQFPLTSAELAGYYFTSSPSQRVPLEQLLYIRRGLSDLQTKGAVEAVPHGQRRCRVTGRKCETWRLVRR